MNKIRFSLIFGLMLHAQLARKPKVAIHQNL